MSRNNQVNASEPIPIPQEEPEGQLLNYEDVLHMAGAQNKYQVRIGILISLGMVLAGLQIMGFPFMFREPAVECESTTTPGKWFDCLPTENMCKNHKIRAKDGTVKSIVVSFDLYCADDEYRIIAETSYMLASALGVIALAPIADKYGKRVALLVSYIVTSVSLVLCPFSPNWIVMLIFLIFSGLGRAPFIYYGFQLLVEVSNEHFRTIGVLIMGVTFAIGAAATSALNIAVNYNWEQFYLFFLAIPSVLGIPLVYYWADESPISYFPAHNYAEARKCLQRIAKVNGRTLPEFKFVPEQTYLPILPEIEGEEMLVGAHKYSYLDLLRYKSLRLSVLGGAYVSFVTYFVFYGQILAIDVLTENPTFVAILTSLIEALACVASVGFLAKFTRKATMIISFTITAIAFLFYGIVTPEKICDIGNKQCEQLFVYLEYVELSVGRFWIAMLMCTTFVYANELFPTVIRSRGSGVVNFFGRIGSIIPSAVIYFCKQVGISPALIFGAVAAPACLIVLFMRETKGKLLLHHIEEEEKADLEKQLLAEQLERMNYLNDVM